MNKHLYRIVFNAIRGLRMAVQETASSAGKNCGETRPSRASVLGIGVVAGRLRCVSFAVLLALGLPFQLGLPAHAQIVAHPDAPGGQRPNIVSAANGVPLVNITTPSPGGISRGVFSQFDVTPKGVILNNSRSNVSTQLGGWVPANAALAGGSARVILNEIRSSHPTHLRGFVEVAGQRAEVIIANPAGVNIDGGGFINASRTTITTGTPVMNNGNLEGFVVQKGLISINGAGLDSRQSDFTGLMARAIEVNAGIWANELKLTAGANRISADQSQVTAAPALAAGPAPAFGIDTAVLGGMYAGKITLVGTEAGLGVRNAGNISASAGSLTLSADGLLTNTGKINSSGDGTLDVKSLQNEGELKAGARLAVAADSLVNSGTIAGLQTQIRSVQIDNRATGRIEGGTVDVAASQNLGNDGIISATGQLDVAATGTLDNRGKIAGQQATLRAATLNNQGASALVAGTSKVDLFVRDTLNNTGGATVYSLGDLNIAADGQRDADGTLLNRSTLVNNDSSVLQADGDLQIASLTLVNKRAAPGITSTSSSSSKTLIKHEGYWMCEYNYYIDDFAGYCAGGYANIPSWYNPDVHINPYAERQGMFVMGWMVESERHMTTTVTEQQLQGTLQPEPKITAGRDLILRNVGNLDNQYGSLMAGRDVTVGNADAAGSYQTASVNNLGGLLNRTTVVDGYSVFRWNRNYGEARSQGLVPTSETTVLGRVGGTMSAGRNFAINNAGSVVNTNALPGQSNVTGAASAAPAGTAFTIPALGSLAIPPLANPGRGFLIESDPRFTNYRQWLSSDAMLSALNVDPSLIQKRLGDGFYEQKLIREQVGQLTGRRFLEGFASEEAQYQALMNSGVTVAQQWKLRPGVALTAEQVSQLTSDMVWLVEQEVATTDGRKLMALVPVVYLSQLHAADLRPTGALMAGQSVSIVASGDLSNNGALRAQDSILLAANKVSNEIGLIDASRGTTAIFSDTDIVNRSGMISGDTVQLDAARDIRMETVARQFSTSRQTSTGNVNGANAEVGPTGSIVSRGDVLVSAGRDVKLAGALLVAQGNASISAGANLSIDTLQTVQSTADDSIHGTRRTLATTQITSKLQTGGNLSLSSGGDTTLRATQASVGKDLSIVSGGNLAIVEATNTSRVEENMRSKGYVRNDRRSDESVVGSNLSATGDVTLAALQTAPDGSQGNVTVRGASVSAIQGQLNVVAANNVEIVEARQRSEYDLFNQSKSKGFLSSKSQTEHITGNADVAVGSSLSGKAVAISAGNNLTVRGSSVVSDEKASLAATQNVNIEAARNVENSTSFREEKKSGAFVSREGLGYSRNSQTGSGSSSNVTLSGSSVSGGEVSIVSGRDTAVTASTVVADKDLSIAAGRDIAIAAGSNTQQSAQSSESSGKLVGLAPSGMSKSYTFFDNRHATQDGSEASSTAQASTVGSLNGNVKIAADKAYVQTGSDVLAPAGNIDIKAQTVSIVETRETGSRTSHQTRKNTTLGATPSNSVINALVAARNTAATAKATAQTGDDRVKAIGAVATAFGAHNTGVAVAEIVSAPAKAASITIDFNLGTSKEQSKSTEASDIGRASRVVAGGDVNITAAGAAANSDLLVRGSEISAGNNATLKAEGDMTFESSQDRFNFQSENKSGGASIGIGISMGASNGLTFNASIEGAKGNASGQDTIQRNTQVTAGNTASLQSGLDTTLVGATVAAPTIKAEVGGKLSIASRSDTSDFKSEQESFGLGGRLCIPPFCYGASSVTVSGEEQNIESKYSSVNAQSGLKAGDGGFQVTVNGDTSLNGAVIASNQAAVEQGKNSFATGGALSVSEIRNSASFTGESLALSLSTGDTAKTQGINGVGVGIGSDEGEASSITIAGISGIAGNKAVRSTDAETGIGRIFEAERVQREIDAQTRITQAFGRDASKAVGDYAEARLREAIYLRAKADQTSNEATRDALLKQADELTGNWGANGVLRLAAHTLIGGLAGGVSGAFGAAAGTLTAPAVAQALVSRANRISPWRCQEAAVGPWN